MYYKRSGRDIVLRLDKGDEIVESIKSVAEKENIVSGTFSGIGATDDFTVGIFDLEKKDYEKFSFAGNHEINCLAGNLTTMNGKPYIHAHITCTGAGCRVVGGHLFSGKVSLTCEIFITIPDIPVGREYNEDVGINTLSF